VVVKCKVDISSTTPAIAMVRSSAIITVALVVFSLLIKSADSRKYNPSLVAQTTTCGSFFYNSQVNNDQVLYSACKPLLTFISSYIDE
jgi:hypothetical protein